MDENQKKESMQEAGKKTAHVAGKTAATYFGGPLGNIAYNKATQTRIGKNLEQGVGNTISKTPGVNKLNKKLNDSGAIDAADKAVDKVGTKGMKSGANGLKKANTLGKNSSKMAPKKTKAPSLGVPKAKSDSESAPDALKNKKNKGLKNKFFNREESTGDDSTGDNDSNQYDDETKFDQVGKALMKKVLIVLAPGIIIGLIILILVAMISENLAVYDNFVGVHTHGTADPEYSYDEKTKELYEQELKYNEKLAETIEKYQKKYNVTLDKYLLHATVSYRYFATKSDSDIYTSDSDITDEDFENFEDELESEDSETTEEETSEIDYTAATKKIGAVAELMIEKSGGSYTTDFEREGIFYNNLLDSKFLKKYYKDYLADDSLENRKKLVDEIFDFADLAKELLIEPINNSFVSDQIAVNLQTCVPTYNYTEINGLKVYNNDLTNEGTSYPTSLQMIDYIKGVLMSELSVDWFTEDLKEMVKTQAILALTFIIGDKESGFDLKNGQMYFPTQTCRQVTCDPTYGCTSVSGVASYTGLDRNVSGRKIKPLTEEENAYLDEIMNEIFGIVIAKPGVTTETFAGSSSIKSINYCSDLHGVCSSCHVGSCVGQNDAKKDALAGMTYKEIFDKYIDSDFELVNIKEGLYVTSNASGTFDGNVIYYKQTDYKDVTFCGRSGRTISSSGCGITSAAIVASSLTGNKQYDPVYMMNLAHSGGYCGSGIVGTSTGFYKHFADKLGFSYTKYSKSQANQVVEALAKGNSMVIAHMGPGNFTSSGHYIVLSGVNAEGQVMVHDPGNSKRNKYWDINLIADELKSNFYVITKG